MRLVIVDGNNVMIRGFFGLSRQSEQLTDPYGEVVTGVYASFRYLVSLLKAIEPTHMVWCFDWGKSSFRTSIFHDYKANRHTEGEKEDNLKTQWKPFRELIEAFGVPAFRVEGVEADDLIAALTVEYSELEDMGVVVVSGDHDLRQLVKENVFVLLPQFSSKKEGVYYDRERVLEEYGVAPENTPYLWSLTGDSSDNIPGVPRVGPKTAFKIWKECEGRWDRVLLHPKVFPHSEQVQRNLKLIELGSLYRGALPSLEDMSLSKIGEKKEFWELLDHYGFQSLKKQLFELGVVYAEGE